MSDFLTRRGSTWHFVRRVPTVFAQLDRRVIIRQSTGIKIVSDRGGRRARIIAEKLNDQLECFWRSLTGGQSTASENYDQARRQARSLGFDYLANDELLELATEKRLERLEALMKKGLANDAGARKAVLGTVARPSIRLSRLFEEYEVSTKDEVKDLSPDQLRIWRNGRIRAVERFVKVVGDKLVAELTHEDAIEYSEWWRARCRRQGRGQDSEQGYRSAEPHAQGYEHSPPLKPSGYF